MSFECSTKIIVVQIFFTCILRGMREKEIASKAKIDDLVNYAVRYAKEQPEEAALLLRAWTSEQPSAQREFS